MIHRTLRRTAYVLLALLDLADSGFISLITFYSLSGFSAIKIRIKDYNNEPTAGRSIKIHEAAGTALGLDFFAEQINFQLQQFAVFLGLVGKVFFQFRNT